jgi:hypothetical protein
MCCSPFPELIRATVQVERLCGVNGSTVRRGVDRIGHGARGRTMIDVSKLAFNCSSAAASSEGPDPYAAMIPVPGPVTHTEETVKKRLRRNEGWTSMHRCARWWRSRVRRYEARHEREENRITDPRE